MGEGGGIRPPQLLKTKTFYRQLVVLEACGTNWSKKSNCCFHFRTKTKSEVIGDEACQKWEKDETHLQSQEKQPKCANSVEKRQHLDHSIRKENKNQSKKVREKNLSI